MNQRLINNCPVCGNNTFSGTKIFIEGRELQKCSTCGQQVSSCSTEEYEIASNHFQQSSGTYPSQKDNSRRAKRISNFLLESISISGSTSTEQIKHLDIGCSDGFTMEVAQSIGLDTEGIETAKTPALNATKKGLKVYHGTLEEKSFPDQYFDIISLFEVIEHITTPIPFLKEISRILKPSGCLVLTTGNIRSISAILLRERWEYYKFTEHGGHISFFSASTIRNTGEKSNLYTRKIITRRVSLTEKPETNRLLKHLSELISLPCSAAGLGHEMIAFLQKKEDS